MSFLSGLKVFGQDIEKAFAWFGSPKGKATISTGEAAVEAIVPASAPIVDLFNTWAAKVYNIESLAVAAGRSKGTGADKATAVISTIDPDVLQFVQDAGVSPRTDAQIKIANDAALAFINAMTA